MQYRVKLKNKKKRNKGMDPFYAYSFLLGIYVGQYTNLFSTVVISGLVVYMVHPTLFTVDKFNPLYRIIYEKSKPLLSKVYDFENVTSPSSTPTSIATSTVSSSPLEITDGSNNTTTSVNKQILEENKTSTFQISLPSLSNFSIKSLPNITALSDGTLNIKLPTKSTK